MSDLGFPSTTTGGMPSSPTPNPVAAPLMSLPSPAATTSSKSPPPGTTSTKASSPYPNASPYGNYIYHFILLTSKTIYYAKFRSRSCST